MSYVNSTFCILYNSDSIINQAGCECCSPEKCLTVGVCSKVIEPVYCYFLLSAFSPAIQILYFSLSTNQELLLFFMQTPSFNKVAEKLITISLLCYVKCTVLCVSHCSNKQKCYIQHTVHHLIMAFHIIGKVNICSKLK